MTDAYAALGSLARWLTRADPEKILGPILGFVAGWLLFLLQERSKVRRAERQLRRALVQELEHTEMIACTIVLKYPDVMLTTEDAARYAREVRWSFREGSSRAEAAGLMSGMPDTSSEAIERWRQLPDEKIVAFFQGVVPRETLGTKVILPVVESVLAGRTAGFTDREITKLSSVTWQAFLLAQEADWMSEFFRMTFADLGTDNAAIVRENHEKRRRSYVYRATMLLSVLRDALTLFRSR